jgi:hypothetical protein
MKNFIDYPILVLLVSLVLLWGSVRIGGAIRKTSKSFEENGRADFDEVLGALLTMLALIIGFAFSMAVARYDQRKAFEEEEANTIGTEYLRVNLLPPADSARTHALLAKYLDQRILFYTAQDQSQLQKVDVTTAQLETDLWASVQTAAEAQPTPMVALAVSGMNSALDAMGHTQAAWLYRLPAETWILMTVIAISSCLMIGFGSRRPGAKGLLFLIIPFVVAISFFLIADIDSPRGGMIQVLPDNLTSLSQSLRAQ